MQGGGVRGGGTCRCEVCSEIMRAAERHSHSNGGPRLDANDSPQASRRSHI